MFNVHLLGQMPSSHSQMIDEILFFLVALSTCWAVWLPLSLRSFPGGTVVKNLPANAGDIGNLGSIPGPEISLGGGNGNPLQYSRLGNPMDRGAWRTIVLGVTRVGYNLATKQQQQKA